ncbi:RNA polymerase sigma factor [Psychromicrobium lacuslunae]|uniref:RNA polymerase subunit sigma-24 n=1 Tax=Psychromicrobium lacuslunae TaxID=1618207 RepID=A0A0D4BWJ4_9MICC|nr:RNA polymerase sigma factor [Psychromicrobium lacuslunae]AJT40684.1 RNA polymerase subunit sigma-24 [Psychromicrobium lacuslunae]
MDAAQVEQAITQAHREEWARVVASLAKRFGDLDIAEESAAEAFATAVERWPLEGVPPRPGAWLTTTANRKAIDRIRRENKRHEKHREAQMLQDNAAADSPNTAGALDDDRLRLIFTCCHPALAMEVRVALTLRMVGGLSMPEIARAFLVQESTMGQRITRAKSKIKANRIPYRVPLAEDLPSRISGVLAVLYLVFNEGYLATGADTEANRTDPIYTDPIYTAPIRPELTSEAIRLTRLIHELMPHDGEVSGLLALMLLIEARRRARVSPDGELVPLDEQDRALWDSDLIAEGHQLVRERLASGARPGRYQVLAAINAVHTSAPVFADTDWSQIVALYDQLSRLDPSPIVQLNRAIAVAELDGAEVGLALVNRLSESLSNYSEYHGARADLLRRVGRADEALRAYHRAVELAENSAEKTYLKRAQEATAGPEQYVP